MALLEKLKLNSSLKDKDIENIDNSIKAFKVNLINQNLEMKKLKFYINEEKYLIKKSKNLIKSNKENYETKFKKNMREEKENTTFINIKRNIM